MQCASMYTAMHAALTHAMDLFPAPNSRWRKCCKYRWRDRFRAGASTVLYFTVMYFTVTVCTSRWRKITSASGASSTNSKELVAHRTKKCLFCERLPSQRHERYEGPPAKATIHARFPLLFCPEASSRPDRSQGPPCQRCGVHAQPTAGYSQRSWKHTGPYRATWN